MSYIGWQAGAPPWNGPTTVVWGASGSMSNVGEAYGDGTAEFYCGLVGGGTAVFSHVWTPLTPGDPDPIDPRYSPSGDLYFPTSASGSFVISATVNGIPAQNTLVLTLVGKGTGAYGSATWGQGTTDGTTPPPPTPKPIGWGIAGGTNNSPTASGYATANTGSADAFAKTAVCGVIGPYSVVTYSHEWIPAIPGAATPVEQVTSYYGVYTLTIAQDRAAGTIRVTAMVDSLASSTVCELTVAFSHWGNPMVYGGFAWATKAVYVVPTLPVTPKFWALFIGTEEI